MCLNLRTLAKKPTMSCHSKGLNVKMGSQLEIGTERNKKNIIKVLCLVFKRNLKVIAQFDLFFNQKRNANYFQHLKKF